MRRWKSTQHHEVCNIEIHPLKKHLMQLHPQTGEALTPAAIP